MVRHVVPRGLRMLAVALTVLVAAPACGDASADDFAAAEVEEFDASLVPNKLLDLRVQTEDVGGATEVKSPFVDGIGLYSLRDGELLQATLQVGRFTKSADADSARFRNSVVSQVGSTVPRAFRMADDTVYLTTGKRQSIGIWFRDRYFFVLSTRDEYETPRALLREALEIKP